MKKLLFAGIAAKLAFSVGMIPTAAADTRLQDNPNLPPDIKRQFKVFEAHKTDFFFVSASLAIVDTAVVCNIKNAEWAEKYRPMVWRMYDDLASKYGLSAQFKYVTHQDVESRAQKIAVALPCSKLDKDFLEQFAAKLRGE